MTQNTITIHCPTCGRSSRIDATLEQVIGDARKVDCSACLHAKSVAFDDLGIAPRLHKVASNGR